MSVRELLDALAEIQETVLLYQGERVASTGAAHAHRDRLSPPRQRLGLPSK